MHKHQKNSGQRLSVEVMMNDIKELFRKNLQISKELDLYLMEHPEFASSIPKGALIVLLPEFDQELCRINKENAKKRKEPGQTIVYVRIENLQLSRVVNPRIEVEEAV